MDFLQSDSVQEVDKDQRTLLVEKVRRWGDLNSDAILDSSCQQFAIPSIDGFIGYRKEGKCAVVFGEPLCSLEEQSRLVEAFHHYCNGQGLNIIFLIVSEKFAHSLRNEYRHILIQFGNKLILDPLHNPSKKTGSKAVLLRKKVKHALNEGVVVREYLNADSTLEGAIEQVGQAWLQSRYGPQIYISHLNFFNDREGKRWFYAKQGDRVVGFLILNEIQASGGWLLNNLILTSHASHGTSELLVMKALETLEMENCKCVVIGPVVADQIQNIAGLGTFFSWMLRIIFKAMKSIFRLDGQRVFWEKFQPIHESSYLVFDQIDFRTIKALLKAMNTKLKKD